MSIPNNATSVATTIVCSPSRGSVVRNLKRAPGFVAALGLAALSSAAFAQQFTDVSTAAGILHVQSRAWGNPIWGDINNDGFLDLIVPVHELDYLGGPLTPFVYLNNKDGTFSETGIQSGLDGNNPDDNKDWLSCSFGDYDGDGNIDFLAVEPPFQSGGDISSVPTRNPLYKGNGDGTFTYTSDAANLEIGRNYGESGFFVDYDNDGHLDLFVKNMTKFLEVGGRPVTMLDGDLVRKHLSSELGFSKEHRDINIRRIGYVASEITKNGGIAICAPIAPYDLTRKDVRALIEPLGGFILVHLSTSVDVCETRDRKGLYAKARAGILKEFTGISDPYEEPSDAEVRINTAELSPEEAAQEIVLHLEREGFIGMNAAPAPRRA